MLDCPGFFTRLLQAFKRRMPEHDCVYGMSNPMRDRDALNGCFGARSGQRRPSCARQEIPLKRPCRCARERTNVGVRLNPSGRLY
jgi:hypothetical protein